MGGGVEETEKYRKEAEGSERKRKEAEGSGRKVNGAERKIKMPPIGG